MKQKKSGVSRNIRYKGKNYRFYADSIVIDDSSCLVTRQQAIDLLDEVVKDLGLNCWPNIDPMYCNVHTEKYMPSFYIISGHIYYLMYGTTEQARLEKQARELLREKEDSFIVDCNVNDVNVLHVMCSSTRLLEFVKKAVQLSSNSFNVNIQITKDLPF